MALCAPPARADGGAALQVAATATYATADGTPVGIVVSNPAALMVTSAPTFTLSSDLSVSRPPAGSVYLSHQLVNTSGAAASYSLSLTNGGPNCPSSTSLNLNGLRLVRDANANGLPDSNEPSLPLNTPGALQLQAGEIATLIVAGSMPVAASGTACATITVTDDATGVTASNHDLVEIGLRALMAVYQSALYTSPLVPGTSRIDYTQRGSNIGSGDAQGAAAMPDGTAILINGAPTTAILLRNPIPAGTHYVAGSLQASTAGWVRLFRLPSDPPLSYRTGGDDASAIEVAIALSSAVVRPSVSYSMQFSVQVTGGAGSRIDNQAEVVFSDGLATTSAASNLVAIPYQPARIGVSEWAWRPVANGNGTADVTVNVRAKNYGSAWLYDVQLDNVLEGTAATQFGTYTSASVPGVGQYTVVPGSLKILPGNGSIASQVVDVNPAFDGTAARSGLLAAGAVMPLPGDFTVQFVVRFNTTGRDGSTLLNSTQASAAVVPGDPLIVLDASVNGIDPDPLGQGDPSQSTSATPIAGAQPQLSVVQQISMPRQVSAGVYDVDLLFKVTNNGGADAPYVRVIDNLNCTFGMDQANGAVRQWDVQGPVRTGGLLSPSTAFTTGSWNSQPCDRAQWDAGDPRQFPTIYALSLLDGNRSLGAGQTEQVGLTVRVTLRDATNLHRASFVNKAWVASYGTHPIVYDSTQLAATTLTAAKGLLVDPVGTVYDAVTRQPVAGAVVNVKRESCDSGPAIGFAPDQLFNGDSSFYTYNADGTLSMTTGSDGLWQFYFLSPPITGKCTYSVSVTPPVGSGYLFPSQRIAPTSGTFSSCGAIVSNAFAPAEGEPTTYYTRLVAGLNADGSACEVLNNHIPLDPGLQDGLVLRKTANKQQVEFGDFIDYALTLTNRTGFTITSSLRFTDTLPAGFAYVPGSARFQGVTVSPPSGGVGPLLAWDVPAFSFPPDQVVVLRYRVRVGVGARVAGQAINRAQVSATGFRSNQAEHTVRVHGGVFAEEAFAFGKVYLDCNRDREQEGEDEPGVPGVRLWLEDGTNVVTDGQGRWSLYGLSPKTHVLRLDETTLPAGARVVVQDQRNAGVASSRFADLKKGEFHKANFPLEGCEDPATRAAIEARRADARKSLGNELTAALRSRLDARAQAVVTADRRGQPASGQINGGASGGAVPAATSGALIDLAGPASRSATGNFLGSGGASSGTLGQAASSRVGDVAATAPLATGQVPGMGAGAVGGAGSTLPGQPGSVTEGLVPAMAAPGSVELERLLPDLDKTPGFVDLRDGDTLPSQLINVRVKGPAGTELRLTVNGQVIDGRRVGKKATLPRTHTSAWEYVGVQMVPGKNRLHLQVVDAMGNERETPAELVVVAPDTLGRVILTVPTDARADPRTPVPVVVRLTDARGVPVSARTLITLESDGGRWTDDDLNPQEPGLQTFVQDGQGVFHLAPPPTPGTVRVRASVNGLVQETPLVLLPELRPMIAVGIVEGTLDLTRRGTLSVDQVPAGAAFENELRSLGGDSDKARVGGRAAFFLKGAIRGEYLLTAALDTDKARKDRLFRDIRPDEFYPVYGDASERAYDAQSSQRLYVRIDKNRSYLLYGDFTTSSSAEVRKLSQTSRTLTGMKGVYDEDGARVTAYGARTSQTQQVEELPGRGISGPYYLRGGIGSYIENSETVELISRDRNQPNVILKRTTLTRLVDYTFEPSLGRLMFVHPIASVDVDLNPQSLRITYETESGGPKYTVAGVDAQFRLGERVQGGVVAHVDDDPKNPSRLAAVTALARVGEATSVAAEAVRTQSEQKGGGTASRVEVRHQAGALGLSGQVTRAGTGFDNPAAGVAAGSTQASARAEYRVDPTTAARAEVIYSQNAGQTEAARGQSVSVLKRLGQDVSVEVGVRHGSTSGSGTALFTENQVSSASTTSAGTSTGASTTASGQGASAQNDLLTLRGRLTATVPGLPQAQVFVEGEQDVRDSQRHAAALGGSYALTDKTRLYGRYELSATLYDIGALQSRNVGLLGIESNYIEGGRWFNEYRVADASTSRSAQIASGVRQTVKLGEHWQLTGGLERSRALGSVAGSGLQAGLGDATAITSGAEYSQGNLRFTGVLETRHGSDANTWLNSLGVGYRLDDAWTLLARNIYNATQGVGSLSGNQRIQSRQQLGLAYRPVDDDRWNVLARYEHRGERITGSTVTTGAISSAAFSADGSLPGDTEAHIISLHGNYSLGAGSTLSGRFAFKRSTLDDGQLKSHYAAQLIYARWTRDLDARWDLGLQGGLLRGSGGALQTSLGVELGYQLARDLWLSVGYNFTGLSDRDLTAGEYTSRGLYLRLRFKFDETGLGFPRAGASRPAASAATAAVDPVGVTGSGR